MKNKIIFLLLLSSGLKNVSAQEKGTFKDVRDGKIYKTVTIGKQVWMAENLAFKTNSGCWSLPVDPEDDDELGMIKIFGYLYDWKAAKLACPSGWHLPSKAEWEILIQTLGGTKGTGHKLKSATGWTDNGNGNNESGFKALGGGTAVIKSYSKYPDYTGDFKFGNWWTATEENGLTWAYRLVYNSKDIYQMYESIENGISVRCIKD